MCRNQLGRRNVTDEQKTVLIGEAYKAQKMTQGGDRGTERDISGKFTASPQSGDLRNGKTKNIIAKQFGVGGTTVERAEHFLDGLNEAEKVSPGIKESILTGEVEATERPGRLFPGFRLSRLFFVFLFCEFFRILQQLFESEPAVFVVRVVFWIFVNL